jgi:hypothetical protein
VSAPHHVTAELVVLQCICGEKVVAASESRAEVLMAAHLSAEDRERATVDDRRR